MSNPVASVNPEVFVLETARAVADAGFPVVATSSGAVAEALGFEDEEAAPPAEMLAAAARIARSVDVPVTVDFEAGYGMAPEELVAALEQWPESGVPDNPAAWLMAIGKRRAIDHFRRTAIAERKHVQLGRELEVAGQVFEPAQLGRRAGRLCQILAQLIVAPRMRRREDLRHNGAII